MLNYSIDFFMIELPKILGRFFSSHYTLAVLLFALIGLMSCSPKGTLNCGSTYKLIAPKFNK